MRWGASAVLGAKSSLLSRDAMGYPSKYGGGESRVLSINVTDDRATMVLVGTGIDGAGGVGAKECDNIDDLPKGAIPIHAPGGNTQMLAQGRAKAVAGLAVVRGIDLLFWGIGAEQWR